MVNFTIKKPLCQGKKKGLKINGFCNSVYLWEIYCFYNINNTKSLTNNVTKLPLFLLLDIITTVSQKLIILCKTKKSAHFGNKLQGDIMCLQYTANAHNSNCRIAHSAEQSGKKALLFQHLCFRFAKGFRQPVHIQFRRQFFVF